MQFSAQEQYSAFWTSHEVGLLKIRKEACKVKAEGQVRYLACRKNEDEEAVDIVAATPGFVRFYLSLEPYDKLDEVATLPYECTVGLHCLNSHIIMVNIHSLAIADLETS